MDWGLSVLEAILSSTPGIPPRARNNVFQSRCLSLPRAATRTGRWQTDLRAGVIDSELIPNITSSVWDCRQEAACYVEILRGMRGKDIGLSEQPRV